MPEEKLSNLPSIEDLEPVARKKVAKLLEELDEVSKAHAKMADREDDLKLELEMIQHQIGRDGFRFGQLVFTSQQSQGRRTLDKMLLLENGCPAAILNSSYKQGAPYTRNIFKRLGTDDE